MHLIKSYPTFLIRPTYTIIALALILSTLGGSLLLVGCSKSKADTPKLKTATVERGDLTQTVVATGRIRPLQQIEVRSRTGGTVRKFYVEEGDFVTKGQKLFEVAPESSPAEQVRTREELNTAQVEVRQAEDKLRIAKELFDKNLAPEQTYLDAQRELDRAHARIASAEAQWALIQRERIGDTENTQNSLDIVATSTTVYAPISGIIFTRELDEGASVSPTTSASGGTVVLTMGDDDRLEFRGDIDEADVGKVRLNMEANVAVQAFPRNTFTANVTHISPVGKVDTEEDRQTVFGVRARVENPEKLLRVGMSATAKLVVDERKNVPIVDEMAVIFKNDSTFVKIVTDTAASATRLQPVTVGISNGVRAEIVEGLKGGELISLGNAQAEGGRRR